MLEIYAPASMGNVAVGFDCLGAALKRIDGNDLGDRLFLKAASRTGFRVSGYYANQLPQNNSDNIVLAALDLFHSKMDSHNIQSLDIHLQKGLPVGSGLGSSASSICAAIAGFNAFYQHPFGQAELLHMMAELEGSLSGSIHYDNAAPCFLGGMQLMTGVKQQPVTQISTFDNWYWVVAYPGTQLNTAASRAVLPKQLPLKQTVQFGQQLASFIAACTQGDEQLAAAVFTDCIAEPHRSRLIPHLADFKRFATQYQALAASISGAGPTSFAVFNSLEKAQDFESWCQGYFEQDSGAFVHVCQLDQQGVTINECPDESKSNEDQSGKERSDAV